MLFFFFSWYVDFISLNRIQRCMTVMFQWLMVTIWRKWTSKKIIFSAILLLKTLSMNTFMLIIVIYIDEAGMVNGVITLHCKQLQIWYVNDQTLQFLTWLYFNSFPQFVELQEFECIDHYFCTTVGLKLC